jgi:oligopeptide transport system substrate-binding protein
MMNTAFHPTLEGWNDTWEDRFDEMYGYDPDAARELMRQAGYGPDNPMEFQIWNYNSSDEPETPVMVEALINYWEPIGVELKLVDSEWGTVRGYYRSQGDEIKKGGWGNVITMRSLVDRIRSWDSVDGTGRNWETNLIDQNWKAIGQTNDLDEIDRLIGEVGNERFDNFADIPFFWFGLEVTVNPEVIEDWTFPGTSASKTSHWNLLKAAQ